jgi:hypothetical protein
MSVALFTSTENNQIPRIPVATDLAKLFRPGNTISVTANVAGDGDAVLPNDSRDLTVLVTSGDANHIVTLPAPIPGTRVAFVAPATAFKIQSSAPATVGISGGTGATAKVTIAAGTVVELLCTSTTNWRGTVLSATIGTAPVQVAAAA